MQRFSCMLKKTAQPNLVCAGLLCLAVKSQHKLGFKQKQRYHGPVLKASN